MKTLSKYTKDEKISYLSTPKMKMLSKYTKDEEVINVHQR